MHILYHIRQKKYISHHICYLYFYHITCWINVSWKTEDYMSRVGWVLQLQDGTTDFIGLQRNHCSLSPLHSKLYSLIWTIKSFIQKRRFCSTFITYSTKLVKMVTALQDWSDFQLELRDLAVLRESFPRFNFIYLR